VEHASTDVGSEGSDEEQDEPERGGNALARIVTTAMIT
jgi:hypothetical protein